MRTTPILDSLHFLIGNTPDHQSLGSSSLLLVLLYAALLVGSVAIGAVTYARDAGQRNARSVTIWLCRLLIGTMWFQGALWKLPLPVSGGFQYWTQQLADNSANAWHAGLVRDVLLPNIKLLDPAVYTLETAMAVSLMLGIGVRLMGLVGLAFMANLWIGLYHNDGEWPWNYVFAGMLHLFFSMDRAGACLGLDTWLWGKRLRS
jgi:uncharacterized membrane protein YphA (DoxX/SURF4 family)